MNNERTKKRTPVVFYISLVLLCLVMISSHMTGGLYARYTASGSGSDSARVAKFEITDNVNTVLSTDIFEAAIAPGNSVIREFTVVNNSEVAVEFKAHLVSYTSNLPIGYSLNGSIVELIPDYTDPESKVKQASPVSIGVGETKTIRLSLNWTGSSSTTYCGKSDILRIEIRIEQID